jgi:outer membrane protein TolC
MENEIPIELAETAIPEELFPEKVDRLLLANREEMDEETIANHPKIKILENKIAQLEIDRQLKANGLLPDVNLEYSFYSQTPDALNSFNTDNYFAGLQISVPLFLRKERGALQLAKYKLQDAELEQVGFTWNLTNKIKEAEAEVSTLRGQVVLNQEIVQNYGLLLQGEERKFQLGESTLFLVNSRENRYIEYSLKQLELKEKLFQSQAKFFNTLALPMP